MLFPDAKQWVERFFEVSTEHRTAITQVSLKDFMKAIGYKHPPELLTMYFCLFGDKSLLRSPVGLTQYRELVLELRSARIAFLRSTGVQPHPCTVAKSLMSTQSRESAQSVRAVP